MGIPVNFYYFKLICLKKGDGNMGEKCQINISPGEKSLTSSSGENLFEVLQDAGIKLRAECGGEGTCGNCLVKISDPDNFSYQGGKVLDKERREKGYYLACQIIIEGDLEIKIPGSSLISGQQILLTGEDEEEYIEHTLDRELEVELAPLYRRDFIEITPPSLQDNTSDLERLRRELSQQKQEARYTISRSTLGELADGLRDNDWEINVDTADHFSHRHIISISGEKEEKYYGLAVDIGTTTVVASLLDPVAGKEVARAGEYNHQSRHGDDVIARINFASKNENGVEKVHKAVINTINELISNVIEQAGISSEQIKYMLTAGNTTMMHTLYGIDPNHIRHSPFTPTFSQAPPLTAEEIGLQIYSQAPVYSFSAIGSFVGGDIISGVLATRLFEQDELTMLIDIGTNGEVVVGNSDFLIACSASAGPAFEGGGITHGVRALEGAIEQIRFAAGNEPLVSTIEDEAPIGICGTGLIDLLATMQKEGIINRSGRYNAELETDRLRERTEDNKEFVLVWKEEAGLEEDIVLTEHDIKHILRSKAAIYAAVKIILDSLSFTEEMIQQVFVAGGFGNYLNVESAVRLGLFPDLDREKFKFVGNSSLQGARRAVLSAEEYKKSREIAQEMTYLELSSEEYSGDFMDEFVAAQFIPHTDLSLFPGI